MKEFSRYLMRMLPKFGRSYTFITRFSLVRATNKGGIAYTKVNFRMDRKLTAEELAVIEPMAEQAKMISKTIGLDTEADTGNKHICHNCGAEMNTKDMKDSEAKYGTLLCVECQNNIRAVA